VQLALSLGFRGVSDVVAKRALRAQSTPDWRAPYPNLSPEPCPYSPSAFVFVDSAARFSQLCIHKKEERREQLGHVGG
jgi:hypothetical protein